MKNKAALTLEYSQKLEKLNQKFPQAVWFEESGLSSLWSAMVKLEEDTMRIQAALAQGLQERVLEHLNAVRDTSEQFRKNLDRDGQAHSKQYSDVLSAMQRAKDVYHKASRDLELAEWFAKHEESTPTTSEAPVASASAPAPAAATTTGGAAAPAEEPNTAASPTTVKREKKLARLREEATESEIAYRTAIVAATSAQEDYYHKHMPKLLDEFQQVYYQRAQKLQETLAEYSALLESACTKVEPLIRDFKAKVQAMSPQHDIEEFVTKTETFFTVPVAPPFETFQRAPEGQPPPGALAAEKSFWHRLTHADGKKSKGQLISSGPQPVQPAAAGTPPASSPQKVAVLGVSIETLLEQQKDSYPNLKVPFIANFLADGILKLEGTSTVGIFRLSGSLKSIEPVKARICAGDYTLPKDVNDCSVMFKLFFRSLPEPILPQSLYSAAVAENCDAVAIFEQIPEPAKTLGGFVVKFIRNYFLKPEVVAVTQMDAANLASVFAPCFLRSQYVDLQEVVKLVEKEKAFLVEVFGKLDYPDVEPNPISRRPAPPPPSTAKPATIPRGTLPAVPAAAATAAAAAATTRPPTAPSQTSEEVPPLAPVTTSPPSALPKRSPGEQSVHPPAKKLPFPGAVKGSQPATETSPKANGQPK